MDIIGEALQLLVVGMLTVFVILLIVIFLGKGLIALVISMHLRSRFLRRKLQRWAVL